MSSKYHFLLLGLLKNTEFDGLARPKISPGRGTQVSQIRLQEKEDLAPLKKRVNIS
jgi:hypothetical protein